ncbi:MAG: asparaginase [Ramlibacter sp.]
MSVKKIVVLGTGGTIAGTAASPGDNVGYTAAQVGVAQLLAPVAALQGLPLHTEQVAQLDSKDMTFEVWRTLALRCAHWLAQDDVQGLVITHGTDTLEETAYFLQAVLAPAKPVVLTCAMRPSTAMVPDGPQNLVDAVTVACLPAAHGVVAVCAGVIHGANDVQKVHTYRLDAFGSGDAGPLGYVEEGAVRVLRPWPAGEPAPAAAALAAVATSVRAVPQVEIVLSHAGATGALVRALAAQGVQGIVVAGTGNGTLHSNLLAALHDARQAGMRVVRATRCANGRVLATGADAFPDSRGLSPVKARIALMLELMH